LLCNCYIARCLILFISFYKTQEMLRQYQELGNAAKGVSRPERVRRTPCFARCISRGATIS
jgi:hypothetical protein